MLVRNDEVLQETTRAYSVFDYWPLLTHQFLHGGWLHIIGNMWMDSVDFWG